MKTKKIIMLKNSAEAKAIGSNLFTKEFAEKYNISGIEDKGYYYVVFFPWFQSTEYFLEDIYNLTIKAES